MLLLIFQIFTIHRTTKRNTFTMTNCVTGTNSHRFPKQSSVPTTPDSSITDTTTSNNNMAPLHAAHCCLPRRYERRFSSDTQFPAPEARSRTAMPMLPHLYDDENDAASIDSRSPIPSLKLKPRPKFHARKHRTHKKSTLRQLHRPSSHTNRATVTPLSKKLPPTNVLQPLGQRSGSTSNKLIVGKSLMERKNHNGNSRTMGKRAMTTMGTNRTFSWHKAPSNLTLRPRFQTSTLPSSSKVNNKENQARAHLPYLFLA